MFGKLQILCLVVFCAWFVSAKAQTIKSVNTTPRLVVESINRWRVGDKNISHSIFYANVYLLNYSNDTLKFWTTRKEFRELFELEGFKNLNIENNEEDWNLDWPRFEQLVVLPHRSEEFHLKFTGPNMIKGQLKIKLKLFKWFNTKNFENDRKQQKFEMLSDNIIVKFDKQGYIYTVPTDLNEKIRRDSMLLPESNIYILTSLDRKLYSVTVDPKTISKSPHFLCEGKNDIGVLVPVIVHNEANDTLKYYINTCTWQPFYHIDNRKFTFPGLCCDKDVPKELIVPPHSSASNVITVVYKKNTLEHMEVFRIGLSLYKEILGNDGEQKRDNIIWSNEVHLKTH